MVDPRPFAAALTREIGAGVRLCQVTFRSREVTAETVTAQGTLQIYRYELGQGRLELRNQPSAGCPLPTDPPIRAFAWSGIDLSVLPAMLADARRRMSLGPRDALSHLMLRRAWHVDVSKVDPATNPAGIVVAEPQWDVWSAGDAHALYDLGGRYLSGKGPAGAPMAARDFFADATAIPALIAAKLGKPVRVATLLLLGDRFYVECRPIDGSAPLARYSFRDGVLWGPEPAAASSRPDLDQALYDLGPIDLTRVPSIIAQGRTDLAIAEAPAASVELVQPPGRAAPLWRVVYRAEGSPVVDYDLEGNRVR